MSAVDFWLGRQRDTAADLPGADLPWLVRLREDAIDRFADEGWPTTRRENWRHTSLAFMAQQALAVRETVAPEAVVADLRARYRAALGTAQDPARKAVESAGDDGHWVVFVDGHFAPALSAIGGLPGGVRIGSLADALAQTPEKVEAAFGQAGDGEAPAALNAALAADGA
ncbi:MAG TPA: Fe-S cluster assembly protein SufD, partial [Thauera aminoaromatica]|nr:Fe-S cluster assembly protein SufD [Thauera aminoaromatica]